MYYGHATVDKNLTMGSIITVQNELSQLQASERTGRFKVRSCNCTLILSACVKIKFSVPSGGDIDEQTTLLLSINFCQEEARVMCAILITHF